MKKSFLMNKFNFYNSEMVQILRIVVLLFISIATFTIKSQAADIYIWNKGASPSYVIEGQIVAGDFKKFEKLLRDNQSEITTLYIFSSGGDFEEGMKIGRLIRKLEISSMVPMKNSTGGPVCDDGFSPTPKDPNNCICASACFFIHIGGMHRGGNYLAVHRPYFSKGHFGKLPEAEAKKKFDQLQDEARTYMKDMGVPKHIQEDVLGTSSDRILVLDDKVVKTYFWGLLPSRHEWVRNKCSEMNPEEFSKYKRFQDRFAKKKSFDDFSDEEMNLFKILSKKNDAERDCIIAASQKSRKEAYLKFFGKAPSDINNHEFSDWITTLGWLGKSFADIKNLREFEESEEAFQKGTKARSVLSSKETVQKPGLLVYDKIEKRQIVDSISMYKSKPSKEFVSRVSKSLEKEWGQPKLVPDYFDKEIQVRQWVNEKVGYIAKLKYEPKAAGGLLSLEIDSCCK